MSPRCLQPRGLEPSVTPLPTNQKGISPLCAHSPLARAARRCHGTPLWDSFPPSRSPTRRGYLLRAREQGRVWDGGAGPGSGAGGREDGRAAPIRFRMVRGSSPRRPLLLKHDFPYVWSWQRRLLRAGTHSVFTEHALCHHYRRFSANLHMDCVAQLFQQTAWEGRSHRRSAAL